MDVAGIAHLLLVYILTAHAFCTYLTNLSLIFLWVTLRPARSANFYEEASDRELPQSLVKTILTKDLYPTK
jgi:hypothetical protein